MKNLLIFIALISIFSCQKQETDKDFFSGDNLDKLNIDNLSVFFGTEELSTYASPFAGRTGYVDGIGYKNSEGGIFVSVFESEEKAIERMQDRINTVSCIIDKGTSSEIEDLWWYTDCAPNAIFKNQWNTIIEVYSTNPSFEEIQNLLINTVNEVTERVKDLSE